MRTSRAVIYAIVLSLLAAAPVAAAASPFTGSWAATDVDGSAMTMTISNGPQGSYRVGLVDHLGSICVTNGAVVDVFQGSAVGSVDGDVLAATWIIGRCGGVKFDFDGGQFFMEYLPETDQLFGMDVFWHRTQGYPSS
jgi:hypothetical protein